MKMGMSPRGLPFPPAMLTPRESLTPCKGVEGDRVIVKAYMRQNWTQLDKCLQAVCV